MAISAIDAIAQIDAVLGEVANDGGKSRLDHSRNLTLCAATISRLAKPGSEHIALMNKVKDLRVAGAGDSDADEVRTEKLFGILMALRSDYEAGRMQTFQEMVHADLFSDFLAMAEYFLEESYKDPAAVMAGGVLEEHLRKLCARYDVTAPANAKLDLINAELVKASAYGKNEQKQVTAWAAIRITPHTQNTPNTPPTK